MILITIAGHLGADPETRYTSANLKVTTFRVATNIKRGAKEKTVWWRVTIFGDRFDKKLAYLKKGSAALVVGEMGIPDIYTDKEGNPQTSFEIIADSIQFNPFGGGKSTDRAQGNFDTSKDVQEEQKAFSYGQQALSQGPSVGAGQANFSDDDLPF